MVDKILLVDDVSMFIELQKNFLENSAVTVLAARDGREALNICRTEHPSLVFMDLHMPVMDGAGSCKAIKEDSRLRSTRVILITSEGKDADRELCLAAGCDHFLTKPLDRQIYLETARKFLPTIDRREKRVACHLRAKFRAFGVTLSGFIMNLSQNGAYLATEHALEQGAMLNLIFSLPDPDGAIIEVRGRVAWVNSKKDGLKQSLPEGVGIEFTSPSEATARDLTGFIRGELALT